MEVLTPETAYSVLNTECLIKDYCQIPSTWCFLGRSGRVHYFWYL